MVNGLASILPSGLIEHLQSSIPRFAALADRHQQHIARMLWDYANSRYQHRRYGGAAFSTDYMRALWGSLRTRNRIVKDFFVSIQGDNLNHLISDFAPYDFLGRAFVDYLEDETPIDFLDGAKRMRMPINPILSRAASNNPEVRFPKHSKWHGINPSRYMPINQAALRTFYCDSADPRRKVSALRLLKLSRNTRCPGEIPVLYEQKSAGRLTEVLFALQSTQREVMSAALSGYWDYDLNNAHFSVLSAWAKKLGRSTSVVDDYLLNKRDIRLQLAKHCDASPDNIKSCLIALLYGAPLHSNPDFAEIPKILGKASARLFVSHPFVRELKREIAEVGAHIVADTYTSRGCYVNAMDIEAPEQKKRNAKFNLLCHALQGVEARALKAVIAEHGDEILLCMHDGWVARRRLNCEQLKALINSATGFELDIEEHKLPKYLPSKDQEVGWCFADSTPLVEGFYVSASPDWSTQDKVLGRITRTDLQYRRK